MKEDILSTPFPKEDSYHALNMPVYNNAAFEFSSAEETEAAFKGLLNAHTYSRISNPTIEFFEKRVKVLSGAQHVTALSSGMAAISNTFFCIAQQGMNIVTSSKLFGNTYGFFTHTMQEFGVEIRFCNMLNLQEVEQLVDENTCAIFTEVMSNPGLEVIDMKALSAIARSKRVPFIVDTTLIAWTACQARNWGVDIEVVSSTKYISGGATSIGGLIVDHGTYDWADSPKLKELAKKLGKAAFFSKLRSDVFRNIGACMSPQTAFMQNIGLETIQLRYDKVSESCCRLAHFLQTCPRIVSVIYPGLESNPFHEISKQQFGANPGALLSFLMKDKEACFQFINRLQVIRRSTNLFDNKSLIIHPASTIYHSFTPEEKEQVGVPDNMIRLSVGLEDIELLKEDILSALG